MASPEYEVLVGSFGPDILHFHFDTASGHLTGPLAATAAPQSSWLVPNRDASRLYAVHECGSQGQSSGGYVSHFDIPHETGALPLVSRAPTLGDHPTYCFLSPDGQVLGVANYAADGEGSLSLITLAPDGRLGATQRATTPPYPPRPGTHTKRQRASHVHCVCLSPDGHWLFEVDLGHDQVRAYPFPPPADITLWRAEHVLELAPGSGPRHLLFSGDGRIAWLTLELSGQVMALAHHHGEFHPLQTRDLAPRAFVGERGAGALHACPDGHFLYVVNRGDDNHLYVFECELSTGLLDQRQRVPTRGRETREFAIAPGGHHLLLANQADNQILVMARNPRNGLIGDCIQAIEAPAPACFVFVARNGSR
ncbi:lactonase family protein [Pseudomonas matsuisoli]|uniref:Gluconolactonase n=1 Tax=Pseudomonas matsuisoli TaxID=1515666 RepID=A0A917PWI9_9PSED|nr:lactonase family protein [Pseudomonas matsuisoli]GGJ95090.1 gluconolactonase [Pseudomonas matsuisoli]